MPDRALLETTAGRIAVVFEHPASAALLLALLASPWIYPQAPIQLSLLVRIACVLPLLRVLDRLVDRPLLPGLYALGAFFVVDNGKGERAPLKHTVIVKPGETITVHTSFDEPGPWVFHCHLFYHAAAGMVQAIVVK